MIELNQLNYYTPANTCISNSKVSDFLLSREYYFKRHISRELDFKATVPIKIGRIVDAVFSQEKIPYMVKVLKRDDPDLFEIQKTMDDDLFVTEAQMEEGLMRGQAITREPFYQEYLKNGAKFQPILQAEIRWPDVASAIQICGMADVISEDDEHFYIDDCKSVSPMKLKSAAHWYWNCIEMGYDRQMGAYAGMAQEMGLNNGKKIVCRHVVVTKERDGVYKVRLFVLPEEMWDRGGQKFVKGVVALAAEKNWIDPPLNWNDAEVLGPGNKPDYDEEEDDSELRPHE